MTMVVNNNNNRDCLNVEYENFLFNIGKRHILTFTILLHGASYVYTKRA